ncbi:MAG: flagellar basal body P-ring protein FlgI [Gammaproteobacteria bacterium]|nr:flagellar basal body P-ring protein FlgI [Gammaproteobacteria bacterium]
MSRQKTFIAFVFGLACALATHGALAGVRIKDLGRIDGVRDNMVVGYGIVTGLAGTGDSARSQVTLQTISNALREFGVVVNLSQLNSRNVAGVMVTATLPSYARAGDKIDVNVSSMGDARSLSGGTLLMMPLYGPDRKIYALAQGPLSIGGFKYDQNGNVVQRNHPTAGVISEGATIEVGVDTHIVKDDGQIGLLLFDPDHTTASRIAGAINENYGKNIANALDAGRVAIRLPDEESTHLVNFVSRIENISIEPDQRARVVVNERTGTVVSGGDVRISAVTVTHGNLRVAIVTDYQVSQPGGVLVEPSGNVRTETVPQTRIDVQEDSLSSVSLPAGTRVSELIGALNRIKTNTRDVINILQSIKRAGALHAELIVQ